MISQRTGFYIAWDFLKRNHLLVDQILNLVLEVYAVLGIVFDTVRVICPPLIGPIEFGNSIHRLGPYRVDVSSHSQSLVQLCSAFGKLSKVPGRLLLKSGSRWIITALWWSRHLLITSCILTGGLVSGIRICLVIWWWSLVVRGGILVWLDIRRGCSVALLYIGIIGSNIFVDWWWNFVKWRGTLVKRMWILVTWRGILVGWGSILVNWRRFILMSSLRVASLLRVLGRSWMTLGGWWSYAGLPPFIRDKNNFFSLFFSNNLDDLGNAATQAIFPVFKPSLIVSPTLTISENFSPTSNMILS